MQHYNEKLVHKFDMTEKIAKVAKSLMEIDICDVEKLHSNYILKTVDILNKNPKTVEESEIVSEEYFIIVDSENFNSILNDILNRVKKGIIEGYVNSGLTSVTKSRFQDNTKGVKSYSGRTAWKISNDMESSINVIMDTILSPELDSLRRDVDFVLGIDTSIENKKLNFENCCKEKMIVNAAASQLRCVICGKVKKIWGVVFENYQFYNQDGQKSKHGSYEPSRHYKMQLDCIQGKMNKDIPTNDIKTIKDVIDSNGIVGIPSCQVMRICLKECKLTKYNNYVPLILRVIFGSIPHQLTFTEEERLTKRFNRAMEVYESIKKNDEQNRRYYPYFIYKCIESEFTSENGPLSLLSNIHLQSKETLASHDEIYQKICELTNTEYRPTLS